MEPQNTSSQGSGEGRTNNLPDAPRTYIPIIIISYLVMWRVLSWFLHGRAIIFLAPILALCSMALTLWFATLVGVKGSHNRSMAIKFMLYALLGAIWVALSRIGFPPVIASELLLPGVTNLMLIWFAASIGGALSYLLSDVNLILPVSIALAFVDIWTVLLGGPVQKALQSTSPVAHAVRHTLLVKTAPQLPIFQLLPSIGFADYLFIAFFVAAICRFSPNQRTYSLTMKALIVTLCAYMGFTIFFNVNLPALVPMAVVMIGLHWKSFRYSRSEAFAMLYAVIVVLLIILAFRAFHI